MQVVSCQVATVHQVSHNTRVTFVLGQYVDVSRVGQYTLNRGKFAYVNRIENLINLINKNIYFHYQFMKNSCSTRADLEVQLMQQNHCDEVLSNDWNTLLGEQISQHTAMSMSRSALVQYHKEQISTSFRTNVLYFIIKNVAQLNIELNILQNK